MFRPSVLLFFFLLGVLPVLAQSGKPLRYQAFLISENDAYAFRLEDRYYTNGLMLRLNALLHEDSSGGTKKLLQAEAGQQIYTPYSYKMGDGGWQDRPFTALLYVKGGVSYIRGEDLFQWSVLAGVTGKGAGGEEVQTRYHYALGFPDVYGWETQLRTAPGVNLQGQWYKKVNRLQLPPFLSLHAKGNITAGTLFNRAGGGLLLRFGKFNPAFSSAQFDAHLSSRGQSAPEVFLFVEPELVAQVYNATLQGGLFSNNSGRFTAKPSPLVYQQTMGAVLSRGHWTTRLALSWRTREARSMVTGELFGSLGMGYNFR